MQYDDQQRSRDSLDQSGSPFDFLDRDARKPGREGSGAKTNPLPRIPSSGRQFQQPNEPERASLRQQAQHCMGNLGGVGNIFDEPAGQSDHQASNKQENPFSSLANQAPAPEKRDQPANKKDRMIAEQLDWQANQREKGK